MYCQREVKAATNVLSLQDEGKVVKSIRWIRVCSKQWRHPMKRNIRARHDSRRQMEGKVALVIDRDKKNTS